MLCIVLSRLYLHGKHRQIIMVIYKEIHFAFFLIVEIMKFETMRYKFLGNDRFM